MKVNVYPTYLDVDDRNLRGCSIVVIDVLRATTSIVQAIDSGALYIIPVGDLEEAVNIHRARGGQTILAGERDGKKIDTFDLGNSPQDFLPDIVRRHVIVMSTTNGSAALERVRRFYPIWVGALRNRKALCTELVKLGQNVALICSGTDGKASADDLFCAGSYIRALRALSGENIETDDLGLIAEHFYNAARREPALLGRIAHVKTLHSLGLDEDISFSFQEDVSDALPVLFDGLSIADARAVNENNEIKG